ncbi:carbohydrate ABC transporter permease [Faecalicatena contorta]|uniref:carbohydrate ABC transporter permease n=1 Tax=Faecalicatena contorta TaxID=39482 RepID=UPI00129ECA9F|nr:carbohydrate ABC transporter permease [Faecalicatena contorta]MRM89896.1 carbohydrate ABC transporter permease [Faecalicatena contorta]
MKTKKRLIVVLSYVILIMVALISVCPVIYTIMIATKQPVDAFSTSFSVIYTPVFDNFYSLWVERGFTKYLFNTLVVTGCCVLISVPTATLGAYGLIRNGGKFATKLLNSTLLLRMFPQMLLAIPYFIIATNLNLADTKLILVIIVVASNQPFALWLMRGFLITIPPELDEAAKIDGCNMVQTVLKVILPVARPGIATASIFTFLLSYNEYLFALILTQKNAMTLPVAIGQYGAEDLSYWTLSAAGVVSIIIPICLVMIFLQKYLVKGMVAGAVKG